MENPRKIFRSVGSMLPGNEAPQFVAPAVRKGDKVTVDLNKLQGSYVILVFYPEDFEPTIVTEMLQLDKIR